MFFPAPRIGFEPTEYSFDENAGVAKLIITTSDRSNRFTDERGALFYTVDGTADGSGGITSLFCTLN